MRKLYSLSRSEAGKSTAIRRYGLSDSSDGEDENDYYSQAVNWPLATASMPLYNVLQISLIS